MSCKSNDARAIFLGWIRTGLHHSAAFDAACAWSLEPRVWTRRPSIRFGRWLTLASRRCRILKRGRGRATVSMVVVACRPWPARHGADRSPSISHTTRDQRCPLPLGPVSMESMCIRGRTLGRRLPVSWRLHRPSRTCCSLRRRDDRGCWLAGQFFNGTDTRTHSKLAAVWFARVVGGALLGRDSGET